MDLLPHLLPRRVQLGGGYAHAELFLTTEPGVTAQHVVDPDFWRHTAERMRVNDRIEVVAPDGSYDMDLRVVALDPAPQRQWARVRVLRFWARDAAVPRPQAPGADAAPPGRK